MKNWIDRLAATCVIVVAIALLPGCPPAPAPPPAFVGCGLLTATVTGRFLGALGSSINTTATLDDGGTSVTWTAVEADEVAGTGTGRVIDGFPATGVIPTVSPRTFTAIGSTDAHTITVTGTINGPPPTPCTGSGRWTITTFDGSTIATGRWTVP